MENKFDNIYRVLRHDTGEITYYEVFGREIGLGDGPAFTDAADAYRCADILNMELDARRTGEL